MGSTVLISGLPALCEGGPLDGEAYLHDETSLLVSDGQNWRDSAVYIPTGRVARVEGVAHRVWAPEFIRRTSGELSVGAPLSPPERSRRIADADMEFERRVASGEVLAPAMRRVQANE